MMEMLSTPLCAGDHDVVICEVRQYENLATPENVLYTQQLREMGLMP